MKSFYSENLLDFIMALEKLQYVDIAGADEKLILKIDRILRMIRFELDSRDKFKIQNHGDSGAWPNG